MPPANTITLTVRDYDLDATLSSGQTFRWRREPQGWEGVIGSRWVRLSVGKDQIQAETAESMTDWDWLTHYLQVHVPLDRILATFPDDEPMRRSVAAWRGLRLLRQEPWECLASFILSSTKQIVQIQQIVAELCRCLGTPVSIPAGTAAWYSFPGPEAIVAAGESQLRACKMGFRAPNLLATARMLVNNEVDLSELHQRTLTAARSELLRLPGVGPKIADCVLLFGFGFAQAFPVDVWVMKALRQLYFPRRRPSLRRVNNFISTHFGVNAGYAQQYLFHYMRMIGRRPQTSPAPTDAS